jgi:mRNA deadenylase 3'-5' endonuclease subunit Ccr4
MSSAISVASSVSDEDEVRHHDDLVDEEAAGHGKDPRDENHKYRLKLLNFNVFAGSPVPVLFRSLLPKTESLEGSVRLKLQVERIKAMGPDIICLQEACSDGVER